MYQEKMNVYLFRNNDITALRMTLLRCSTIVLLLEMFTYSDIL